MSVAPPAAHTCGSLKPDDEFALRVPGFPGGYVNVTVQFIERYPHKMKVTMVGADGHRYARTRFEHEPLSTMGRRP